MPTEAAAPTATAGVVIDVGLTLAGAISAGAYTAGVLDFLFQALDEWERHRSRPGTPTHRVVIKVMTGASAGAITGALSAVALARGLHPQALTDQERAGCYPSYRDGGTPPQPYRHVVPALWRTWVDLPDMLRSGRQSGLLGLADLEGGKADLVSLLDSTVLDRIKTAAIGAPAEPAERAIHAPVPYVSARLHIYMTLSNMRGIPYNVGFGRFDNKYGMLTHADRAHYVIAGLGSDDRPECSWLRDGSTAASTPLSVQTLPRDPGQPPTQWPDWDRYGTAALASGAFPAGLAPRHLSYTVEHYTERKLPINLPDGVFVTPSFPPALQVKASAFAFQTVDGGMINNNPFDYAQYALFGTGVTPDSEDPTRTIIMVAPFPDPPKFLQEGAPRPTLVGMLTALYPALINQARFRISELAPALNARDYSRYLISPRRQIPRPVQPPPRAPAAPAERFAIACGLLGGFGGFLGEDFRAHDFQLGRRNCQLFLSGYFTAPPARLGQPQAADGAEVPILPLFGSAIPVVPLPVWPRLKAPALAALQHGIGKRLGSVVRAFIRGETGSRILRAALLIGWLLFLRCKTKRALAASVLADLVRRDQVEGYDMPIPAASAAARHGLSVLDARAVLAELISPSFRYRSVGGIAAALSLEPQAVTDILIALSGRHVADDVRSWPLGDLWTTWRKRPWWVERLPVLRAVFRWLDKPAVG
jgi:hypothetical protein